MKKAEIEMVKYLIYDGGADCCQKCIHIGKTSCPRYVSETDYSGKCSDEDCIDGMVKYFEQGENNND